MIKLTSIILLVLGYTSIEAQNVVNASGGNIVSNEGSVSYSIGQIACQTLSETSGSICEGIQQSFEIFIETVVEEDKGINLSIKAYPNPFTDYLTLRIDKFNISNLSYQLYNTKGKLMQYEKIISSQTNIFLDNFEPAIYFVKIIHGKKEVETFKIIKKLR